MPSVNLDGRKLGYVRRGSGEPLLLIPGMAMHYGVWDERFLSLLETDFDIIAFNHRNIGDSDDAPGDFTISDLADDAVALLDALAIESAHVLGFSMGGLVAQEIAINHPDRVRTLILAATYAGGEGSDLNAPGPLSMLTAGQSGDVEVALRASFDANLSKAYTSDASHYAPFKEAALAQRIRVEVVIAQARASFVHNARDRLATVSIPTLVVHGTEDQMILYKNGPLLASLLPDATLHTFDDTGHLFFWEHPQESADLVRKHALSH